MFFVCVFVRFLCPLFTPCTLGEEEQFQEWIPWPPNPGWGEGPGPPPPGPRTSLWPPDPPQPGQFTKEPEGSACLRSPTTPITLHREASRSPSPSPSLAGRSPARRPTGRRLPPTPR